MNSNYVIWQYWETRGHKPLFVDGLHEIAKRNAGVQVVLVTPETIHDYLPSIPEDIFRIKELAHKADMIRAMLLYEHGGMWLDSDAIVLKDLTWLFQLLDNFEFVGFNNSGSFSDHPLNVRINCFLARPRSKIMGQWVAAQHAKFPRVEYAWTEVGTELLDPIVVRSSESVKLLPFEMVCPIGWKEVSRFSSKWEDSGAILANTQIVMLSNKSLHERNPRLTQMSLEELARDGSLIADIINKALDSDFEPPSRIRRAFRNVLGLVGG